MIYALTITLGLSGPPLVVEFATLAHCARVRADMIATYAEKWGAELVGPCVKIGDKP